MDYEATAGLRWRVTFAGAAVLELLPGGNASELALAHALLSQSANKQSNFPND